MWFITINEIGPAFGELIMIEYYHVRFHRKPTIAEVRAYYKIDNALEITVSPCTFKEFYGSCRWHRWYI